MFLSQNGRLAEICVKAEWLSADPFTRIALSSLEIGDTIPGAQVGKYEFQSALI